MRLEVLKNDLDNILEQGRILSWEGEEEVMSWRERVRWRFRTATTPDPNPLEKEILSLYLAVANTAKDAVNEYQVLSDMPLDRVAEYEPGNEIIRVWSGLNLRGRIRSTLHELGHWITWPYSPNCFTEKPPRRYWEQAAEVIAYTCSKALKVDCFDYSVGLIAHMMLGADRHILKTDGLAKCCQILIASVNARRR